MRVVDRSNYPGLLDLPVCPAGECDGKQRTDSDCDSASGLHRTLPLRRPFRPHQGDDAVTMGDPRPGEQVRAWDYVD